MPSVPEDLDVFHLPHVHMKKLVRDIEEELSFTNFRDSDAYSTLLYHLRTNFQEFKCHEDIENQYIVRQLLPRLPHDQVTVLENDIHSDNRVSKMVALVNDGLHLESSDEGDRVAFGAQLKDAISHFTIDFIPHMKEEEEVFLPLLVKHFTEGELRKLTSMVLELHHLQPQQPLQSAEVVPAAPLAGEEEPSDQAHLLSLPPEIILKVFSYLSPRDLSRISQLHSSLHDLAFDGSLWQHLHPVRWAQGHLQFFQPLPLGEAEEEEGKGLSHDCVLENDITKHLLSVEGQVNANLRCRRECEQQQEEQMEREARVLQGLVECLLPRVGGHVATLDLAHGTAVSNETVFRMLRQCPNLRYLDLSRTRVSDFAFRGLLGPHHNCWQLQYIDLTGCQLVTDTALQRITHAISHSPSPPHMCHHPHTATLSSGCGCAGGGAWKVPGGGGGRRERSESRLKCLILSGCHLITDVGLRSLATGGELPYLQYLDLSGLCNVTERGLNDLVSVCPSLTPELLFYCDNIVTGPYADCANGCQNVGSPNLCCRRLV